MRQIELALSQKTVLLVDDYIFNPCWENKLIIESLQKKEFQIKIIPKNSTQSAESFLNSMMSQIKNLKINLRIVTNMNRYNEEPHNNAGARFYNEKKKKNFKISHFSCLLLT